MRGPDALPFRGSVIWLTPDQGGRSSGPPPTPPGHDYAVTAFVPPNSAQTGLASIVIRVDDRSAWRSAATGGWLVAPNEAAQKVVPGSVVVVTEGLRSVAYFQVDEVVE